MIDWHSHILPKMDDGSRDITESVALLRIEQEQGVDTVIATPHFYAERESIAHFLERRTASYESLKAMLTEELPKILLGAEVRYYPGIGQLEGLERLCVEQTQVLLLEMPFEPWSEYTIREVMQIASKGNLKIVLAHIDRYLSFQKSHTWIRLYECGILMQMNANFFKGFLQKRKALLLLKNGYVHFLGSDCHNTTSRRPELGGVFDLIARKYGEAFLEHMDIYGKTFLD